MSRWFQPRALRALLLTALLLVAQLLLLQHQADLGQHAKGENCEWCLTHSPLAGALPAGGLSFLPPLPPDFSATVRAAAFAAPALPAYASRAPPVDLSV